ncbi:hypothetical protein AQPE_0433 [Aquipluma nitroreducens]|uniref:Lipoprotein n=1 Tax=Aquipluma nitroreducens TaxID=2010828 RepID=A0A5K7S446_9BACT|nr:hypothetical protein [Aquipluma nitroreducens]BBE16296.1 hypothetical protein AQPE_0433 [Aquipluma nitroreducens]
MKIFHLFAFVILGIFLTGCATIPKQSASLSEELGYKLTNIEQSHVQLLHNFFEQKRNTVEEFIVEEWIPVYSEQYFSKPSVENKWNEIVSSGNKEDRLKFITIVGPVLLNQINEQRQKLLQPLNDLEKEIEQKIRNEYNSARSINNALTSFLQSAVKVEENRSRYLEMLGVTDQKINEAIDTTDQLVKDLVKVGENAEDKTEKVNSFLSKMEEFKKKINTTTK